MYINKIMNPKWYTFETLLFLEGLMAETLQAKQLENLIFQQLCKLGPHFTDKEIHACGFTCTMLITESQ